MFVICKRNKFHKFFLALSADKIFRVINHFAEPFSHTTELSETMLQEFPMFNVRAILSGWIMNIWAFKNLMRNYSILIISSTCSETALMTQLWRQILGFLRNSSSLRQVKILFCFILFKIHELFLNQRINSTPTQTQEIWISTKRIFHLLKIFPSIKKIFPVKVLVDCQLPNGFPVLV